MSAFLENLKTKENYRLYTVLLIDLLITFGVGCCPPFGQVTVIGMRILGLFLGCIFTWLFGYLGWGSILALLLLSLWVPGNTVNSIFSQAYGNSMLLMIFFCLIFCYGLSQLGLLPFLANYLLSRKWATKSPWTLAVAFWLTQIICCGLTANSLAPTVFLYFVFYEVADKIGIPKRSTYCASVLILMCTLGALGILLMPYSSALWVSAGLMQAVDPTLVPHVPKIIISAWVLIAFSFIFIAAGYWILLKTHVIRIDFSLNHLDTLIDKKSLKVTSQIKAGFFYIFILLLIMVLPSILPAESVLVVFLNKFGTLGAFACISVLMCLTTQGGKIAFTIEESMLKGIPWGVYFMIATAYLVAGLLVADNTGVMATLLPVISTIIPTENIYLTMLAFLAILLIITNCITNFVAMQLVIPIITTILLSMGVNPMIFVGLIGVIADHGNVMPSGSPIGAFMHGNTQWHSGGQVYLWASIGSICAYLALALVALPITLLIA